MSNTGRLSGQLLSEIQKILYHSTSDQEIVQEMRVMTQVDKAHVLMLEKTGNLSIAAAKQILAFILSLEENDYSDLTGKQMPRGLYLLYEDYLIAELGIDIGGMLQFGRSRNDLKITIQLIKARRPLEALYMSLLNISVLLIRKADEYSQMVMPAYTHYQPAVPITYGHYLMGFLQGILRSISVFLHINMLMDKCPLGAGAVGGTTVNIDADMTARLLGFSKSSINSIDAVASRDIVFRLLGELAMLNNHITRICEDLLLWTSSDFGFISLPDCLVGGSSMMPNKRNIFLLENVSGRASGAIGAFVSALTASTGTPFTNSIAVGTEAVSYLWKPLNDIVDTMLILHKVIEYAEPNEQQMLLRAKTGYTQATEIANHLVRNCGFSFREAHLMIGAKIRDKSEPDELCDGFSQSIEETALAANYGFGPGFESFNKQYNSTMAQLSSLKLQIISIIENWNGSRRVLDEQVKKLQSQQKAVSASDERSAKW